MPDERWHMADDIFKLQRAPARGTDTPNDCSPDNGSASRENAGAEIRESAVSPTVDANCPGDSLLDVSQVAEYLRISRSSVYKMIEGRQIPAIRVGRLLRVRKKELDEALHSMGSDL